jgi:hypothetical protein
MTVVNAPEEIPPLTSEADEHEFWKTHAMGPGMFEGVEPDPDLDRLVPVRSRSKAITVRIEGDMLRRLQALAERKGVRYQTLLKEFVTERLYEEEKREGILGSER